MLTQDLYQEVIIDHGCNPRHCGALDNPTHEKEGFNPLCGDQLILQLKIENGVVQEAKFTGTGCAIAMASSSLMLEAIQGKSISDVECLFEKFQLFLTEDDQSSDGLDKLTVLGGVKSYPMRVKCATLAWHTLVAALKGDNETVTTE